MDGVAGSWLSVRRRMAAATASPWSSPRWLKLLERDDYGVDFQHYSAQGQPPSYQYPFLTSPVDY